MNVPPREKILEALRPVQDPEIGIGVVDLGLIYDIRVYHNGAVKIDMTLTTPACPYAEALIDKVEETVSAMAGVTDVDIKIVFDPPWDPESMCSDSAKDILGIW